MPEKSCPKRFAAATQKDVKKKPGGKETGKESADWAKFMLR